MEEHQDMKNRMVMIGAISVIFAIILIASVMYLSKKRMVADTSMTAEQNTTAQTQDAGPQTGTLQLRVKDSAPIRSGKPVTVVVYAHSFGTNVTAYDAVIRYDPKQLTFNEVTSLQTGMDPFDTDQEMEDGTHELIITGVQAISRQEPFVFSNTELAEITFTALTPGTVTLNLSFEKGSNRDSNLFDNSTNEILSGVEGVTLEIQ